MLAVPEVKIVKLTYDQLFAVTSDGAFKFFTNQTVIKKYGSLLAILKFWRFLHICSVIYISRIPCHQLAEGMTV